MAAVNKPTKDEDPAIIKRRIIKRFDDNVRGRFPDTSAANAGHDGKGGHWLEDQMGVTHNASNTPDLWGFEMKNDTTGKTTFGDWSANYYIFRDKKYGITRDDFMHIFGAPNLEKEGRYSWSGKPTPKVGSFNTFGQWLKVDKVGNIFAIYSYSKDQRLKKAKIVPKAMQKENLVIAEWSAEKMKKKVEKKFNKHGWFKCYKNSLGAYAQISFGPPIDFDFWISDVRKGLIYFDSGMYQGNSRNYSQWRASNGYWNALATDPH